LCLIDRPREVMKYGTMPVTNVTPQCLTIPAICPKEHCGQRKRSDADILVEFEKGHKDFFNYMRLKHYLEGLLQKRVDLVMKGAIKRQLKTSILSEAKYV
jgi:hypothetical protein